MYDHTIIDIMIVITRFCLIDFYYLGHCNGQTSMHNTILFQINGKIDYRKAVGTWGERFDQNVISLALVD